MHSHTLIDRPAKVRWKHFLKVTLAGAALIFLAVMNACGGGGGSEAPQATAPTITTQPANQPVVAGNTATFSVVATGNPAPTYQWQRSSDGTTWTEVVGATDATYSFTAQTGDNGAKFRMVATNGVGSPANSQVATLTVSTGTLSFTLPRGVTLDMVSIPGGTFLMGRYAGEQHSSSDEDPQHAVKISPFAMGKFEVTQAQWVALMGSNPSHFTGDLNRPVEQVSWNETGDFLWWLNAATAAAREGTGLVFRLPTEAEWEYAARGTTTTRFYWGDDPSYSQIGSYAWYYTNSGNTTHPVGQKTPHAFGLYDMGGNVCEWCEDDWHGSYGGAPSDGRAWVDSPRGDHRLLRGGSWEGSDGLQRSARRARNFPSYRNDVTGFRVVLASPRTP